MLERVHDLYHDLEQQRVMLSFKGHLSDELITALLGVIEKRLERIEPDLRQRKRVFNVVMECLQNLHRHRMASAGEDEETDGESSHGVVMILHQDRGYSVLTGNYMAGSEVDALRSHLDRVNAMDPEGLRGLYKETLADGRYTERGGGGLGLIDIARRSGSKLEYAFVPFNGERTFFSLNVTLTH